jgi:hypothetical protein
VPEQLALEQSLGDGSAVDGDKRICCAAAGGVNSARKQLLAGTSLADEENGDGSACRYL